MEGKEGLDSSGVTVKGGEFPERYSIAPRSENHSPICDSVIAAPLEATTEMKKKRGRPRKYAPDGSLTMPLSPMPISASIPLTGELSAWGYSIVKPVDLIKKYYKPVFESPGEGMAYSTGANFTPHVITVNNGEDVTMKIISFSQHGFRAICILAANGSISNVTLRQPSSSGGTLTYEGNFEILSLTGSFMPNDNGGTKSRSGGMSVSLAGPDGRVLGGGIAGLLVAAGPVQVVVGSFLQGHQQVQKAKKPKFVSTPAFFLTPANPISGEGNEAGYGGLKPNLTSSFSLYEDKLTQGSKNLTMENHTSLPGSESKEPSLPNPEASG